MVVVGAAVVGGSVVGVVVVGNVVGVSVVVLVVVLVVVVVVERGVVTSAAAAAVRSHVDVASSCTVDVIDCASHFDSGVGSLAASSPRVDPASVAGSADDPADDPACSSMHADIVTRHPTTATDRKPRRTNVDAPRV